MSSDLNDEQKAMINQVRLKLKLLTVSDVVLADSGTRIHPDIYQGTNHRASTIQWPKVLDFPKAWYTLFQSVMVNIIAPKLQSNPLGKWISQGHQRWQYFENNNIVKYVKYKKQYIHEGETSLDDRIYPVDVNDRNGKILGRAPNVYDEDENQSECTSAYKSLMEAPEWMKRTWGSIPVTEQNLQHVLTAIEKNDLTGGGDGSVKYGIGSHAWEFSKDKTNETICQGAGPVDGTRETMCSFRAEATHLVAMVSILNRIQKFVKRKKLLHYIVHG